MNQKHFVFKPQPLTIGKSKRVTALFALTFGTFLPQFFIYFCVFLFVVYSFMEIHIFRGENKKSKEKPLSHTQHPVYYCYSKEVKKKLSEQIAFVTVRLE